MAFGCLPGVIFTTVGYAGGTTEAPSYYKYATSTIFCPFFSHQYIETITGWETIRNVYESLSTLRRLNIKTSSMFFGKAMTPLLRHLGQDEL